MVYKELTRYTIKLLSEGATACGFYAHSHNPEDTQNQETGLNICVFQQLRLQIIQKIGIWERFLAVQYLHLPSVAHKISLLQFYQLHKHTCKGRSYDLNMSKKITFFEQFNKGVLITFSAVEMICTRDQHFLITASLDQGTKQKTKKHLCTFLYMHIYENTIKQKLGRPLQWMTSQNAFG